VSNVTVSSSRGISTVIPLKSYRVVISRRAWSTALTSSWRSNSLTTSKLWSCAMGHEDSDPRPRGCRGAARSARPLRLLLAKVGEQLVDLEHIHEHVARFASLERPDHAVLGELVDEARGAGVADAELALEKRCGSATLGGNRVRRLC